MTANEHPIVDCAIAAIDWRGEEPIFDEAGRAAVEGELRARFGKPDLRDAVRALLLFAFFLHEKKAAAASKGVIDVVQSARGALLAANVTMSDVVADASAVAAARQKAIGADERAQVPHAAAADGLKWWQLAAKGDR